MDENTFQQVICKMAAILSRGGKLTQMSDAILMTAHDDPDRPALRQEQLYIPIDNYSALGMLYHHHKDQEFQPDIH